MRYMGMPFGMWALFGGSFRRELTAVFGLDAAAARRGCCGEAALSGDHRRTAGI